VKSKAAIPDNLKRAWMQAGARLQAVRDRLKEVSASRDEIDHPVPVINTFTLGGEMKKEDEKISQNGDRVCIRGSEFMGTVIFTGVLSPGAPAFAMPVGPNSLGGGRIASFAQLYDLWAVKKLIFEWIPLAPSGDGGAITAYVVSDVFEDPSVDRIGDVAIRDAMERPGSSSGQIFARQAYGVNFPQQAVYYCADSDVPNLTWAGLFSMLCDSSMVATAGGLLMCHYEFEFMSASSERLSSLAAVFQYTSQTLTFISQTLTANQVFFANVASISNAIMPIGTVASMVVSQINLNGVNANMLNLVHGKRLIPFTVVVGTRLWARISANNLLIALYDSWGAACQGHVTQGDPQSDADGCLINVNTTVITASPSVTFALEQFRVFTLPEPSD